MRTILLHSLTFTCHVNDIKELQISYRTKYERDQEEQMCAFHIIFTDMSVNSYYNCMHPVLIINFPFSLLSLRTSSHTICSSSFSLSFSRFLFFSASMLSVSFLFFLGFFLTVPLFNFLTTPLHFCHFPMTFSLGSLSLLPLSVCISSSSLDLTQCSSR